MCRNSVHNNHKILCPQHANLTSNHPLLDVSDDAEAMLRNHWEVVSASSWAQRHPVFKTPNVLPWTIPCRFHGDDASIKSMTGKKLCIVSVHSEFCVLDALTSRLLSFFIFDDLLIPNVTLAEIMEPWVWSWHVALSGIFPTMDHCGNAFDPTLLRYKQRGERLAGPYRFAFAGALGDWSFHSKFYYPHFHGSSHNFLCHRDMASRVLEEFRFQDCRPSAGVSCIKS